MHLYLSNSSTHKQKQYHFFTTSLSRTLLEEVITLHWQHSLNQKVRRAFQSACMSICGQDIASKARARGLTLHQRLEQEVWHYIKGCVGSSSKGPRLAIVWASEWSSKSELLRHNDWSQWNTPGATCLLRLYCISSSPSRHYLTFSFSHSLLLLLS